MVSVNLNLTMSVAPARNKNLKSTEASATCNSSLVVITSRSDL